MDNIFIAAIVIALGASGCIAVDGDSGTNASGAQQVDCRHEGRTATCDYVAVCPEQKYKVGGVTVLKRPPYFSSAGRPCEFLELRDDGSSVWCCE